MKRGDLALVKERIYIYTEHPHNKQTVWKKVQVGTFLILLDEHISGKFKVVINGNSIGWLDDEGLKYIEII